MANVTEEKRDRTTTVARIYIMHSMSKIPSLISLVAVTPLAAHRVHSGP